MTRLRLGRTFLSSVQCAMICSNKKTRFDARLLSPDQPGGECSWAFLVLPKEVSELLPRRGRTSVEGTINGCWFQAMLEPDGQLSHWLKVGHELLGAAGVKAGETVSIEIAPVEQEPEPELPIDLAAALESRPDARRVWDETTTIARVDWIHWVTSAKQAKTRDKRVTDACEMLAAGKKRVCCFDPSGFYSKAFRAPAAEGTGSK
jgi:hypothetical protein